MYSIHQLPSQLYSILLDISEHRRYVSCTRNRQQANEKDIDCAEYPYLRTFKFVRIFYYRHKDFYAMLSPAIVSRHAAPIHLPHSGKSIDGQ